jgi:2-polyprenyl-3-methyl-5-hydroxy-6-metoxy-1,4-benzoquinol methylase
MTSSTGDGTQAHYGRLAASYDHNWAYSPSYIAWMTGCILDRAAIRPGQVVADIGCGTGLYSRQLAAAGATVICADPSQAMLDQLPGDPAIVPVRASAQDIAERRVALLAQRLNAIVIKEAVHHIPASGRRAVLNGLSELLAPGGRIVIAMLPAQISYPLFTTALQRFQNLQPDPADIAAMLSDAGLETELSYDSYTLTFEKDRYLSMVRDRYMSLLADFTDAELERGMTEIRERFPGDRLEFADRFAFIRGIRAQASAPR